MEILNWILLNVYLNSQNNAITLIVWRHTVCLKLEQFSSLWSNFILFFVNWRESNFRFSLNCIDFFFEYRIGLNKKKLLFQCSNVNLYDLVYRVEKPNRIYIANVKWGSCYRIYAIEILIALLRFFYGEKREREEKNVEGATLRIIYCLFALILFVCLFEMRRLKQHTMFEYEDSSNQATFIGCWDGSLRTCIWWQQVFVYIACVCVCLCICLV